MANAEDIRDHDGYTPDSSRTGIGALVGRYGLVIVIAWFGAMKFTFYEAQGISPLVANSPFMGWLYHVMSISTFGRLLGTAELIAALLLALKPWSPKLSVLGGALAVAFFLGTLSFMLSTPGIGEASAGGFPVLSATGEFLMKDIALLGLSIWLLTDSLDAVGGLSSVLGRGKRVSGSGSTPEAASA
jgi:reactive chlorine resistance protein C